MECSKTFTQKQIGNALMQQRLFFEYVKNQKNAKELDQFTVSLSADSLLRDWLYPMSNDIDLNNRNQWFTALEIAFDPANVWKNYNNPVLMAFSEFDDSTPAAVVSDKIKKMNKRNIQVQVFANAQHLGLSTNSVCNGDPSALQEFHKDFFFKLKKWIKGI